ncbi:hypothetical protein QOZ80_2AG0121900 [Eleusine coracana subsp. coracana]|nr:hypothetical protein QOZ80_2AG0121900 [Eleusine coracana subsp. coracana]
MYLRLGQIDTIVVSSAAAAQEVLQAKDIIFASRPSLLGPEMVCYGGKDIAFAPYGSYWRSLRKVAVLELLSTRKVRQFSPIRDSETMSLVREVYAAAGEPVKLGRLLVSSTNSITGLSTFGHRCSSERRERFLSAMALALDTSLGFCVTDLFPSLWFLDIVTGARLRLRRASDQLDDVLDKIIAEREGHLKVKNVEGGQDRDKEDDDLLSVMLRIRDDGLFVAGTETTSSAAEWVMSELMRKPEAMAKAQAEVRQVFGNTNPRDHESYLDHLQYTNMVIKETMRLHPPLPLLLPRTCRETCDVGGFEVAKGSRVIVNAWAMARSPKYWDDAEEFRPERFEKSSIDYNGTQFEFLPFGSGRRMCPGMSFALVTLQLLVARLLYYFNWDLPAGMSPEDFSMDMTLGATARKTEQLQLVATPCQGTSEI